MTKEHGSKSHLHEKPHHPPAASSNAGAWRGSDASRVERDRDREALLARGIGLPDRRTVVAVAIPVCLLEIWAAYVAQSPRLLTLGIGALALVIIAGLLVWRRERVAAGRDTALLRELEARAAPPYVVVLLVVIPAARRGLWLAALESHTSPSAGAAEAIAREVVSSAGPALAALTATSPSEPDAARAVSRALDVIERRLATARAAARRPDPDAGYRDAGARPPADARALLALAFAVRARAPSPALPASRDELASLASAWLTPYPDAVVTHAARVLPADGDEGLDVATLRTRCPELRSY